MVGIAIVAINTSRGDDTRLDAAIREHQGASLLMSNRTIRVHTAGMLKLDFERGLDLMRRPSLLKDIQRAYAKGLQSGASAEFVVREPRPGVYTFVNRHGQPTMIEELYRGPVRDNRFVLALYVEGKRRFGDFESLIQIDLQPGSESEDCQFQVDVDAYPHNRMLRSISRFGPIKRYFENKTHEIVGIGMGIVESLDRLQTLEYNQADSGGRVPMGPGTTSR